MTQHTFIMAETVTNLVEYVVEADNRDEAAEFALRGESTVSETFIKILGVIDREHYDD